MHKGKEEVRTVVVNALIPTLGGRGPVSLRQPRAHRETLPSNTERSERKLKPDALPLGSDTITIFRIKIRCSSSRS